MTRCARRRGSSVRAIEVAPAPANAASILSAETTQFRPECFAAYSAWSAWVSSHSEQTSSFGIWVAMPTLASAVPNSCIIARRQVGRAKRVLADDGCHRAQTLVALLVTVQVVIQFEVIDIGKQQQIRRSAARGTVSARQ